MRFRMRKDEKSVSEKSMRMNDSNVDDLKQKLFLANFTCYSNIN